MSSTAASATASSSASATPTFNGSGSSPGSFYKNLFYILIGLLCAFGIISVLSLARARRRRAQIMREAERLGVMVPGLPGYIPFRERQTLQWTRSDGSSDPDWWEVDGPKEKAVDGVIVQSDPGFHPLSIIPPAPERTIDPPVPQSLLPFFPNHLAYRPSSLLPPPRRFTSIDSGVINEMQGETLDVVTIIRMPGQDRPGSEANEDEDVMREWGGVELGIIRVDVDGSVAGL